MKPVAIIAAIFVAILGFTLFTYSKARPSSNPSPTKPTTVPVAAQATTAPVVSSPSAMTKTTPTLKPSPTPTTVVQKPSSKSKIEFTVTAGKFVIEVDPEAAPKTVANYLTKWTNGFCQGKTFHRVENWVVQGCDPKGDGTGGGDTLPTETSSNSFTVGSVGVARKSTPKNISNDSQFFIVKNDSKFLDNEYTWFGKVITGMDIVNKISAGDKILSTKLVK